MTRPLRGRAAQLAQGLDAIRLAGQGRSVVAIISGEAGNGKSALADAVAEEARRQGFAIGRAQAQRTDGVAPLASFGPALRSGTEPLLSSADFMALGQLTEQPLWLAERLAAALEQRADDGPLLLLLDDAHWADPLTAFTLRVLPKRLLSAPLLVLLATRPAPGGPADQVAEAALPEVAVVHVDATNLTDDAVLEIAADRLGERPGETVVRELGGVGGNPFLAVQLLDGLFEPGAGGPAGGVPSGLLHGVRRRLSATSEHCRDLVRLAAVLGQTARLADIAQLLGVGAGLLTEPLAEAIRAGLLVDDGSTLRFRHELLREAVYEDIPPSGRRAWHQQIAVHLRAAGRGWAAIAPHVLVTAVPGDTEAVEVLRRAAHEILATMATTSATFIRQAFELTDRQHPDWAALGVEVIDVLVKARGHRTASAFADELLAEVAEPDVVAAVQLLLLPQLWANDDLAGVAARAGDPRAAGAAAGPAARLAAYRAIAAGALPESAAADQTAGALAEVAVAEHAERRGAHAVARESYAKARAALAAPAGQAGAPPAGQLQLRELLAGARQDDIDGGLAGLAGFRADSWSAPRVARLQACLCLGAGRLDEAVEHAARSLRLMDEVHDRTFEGQLRHLLAEAALLRGDHAAVRAQLAAAAEPLPVVRALLAEADGDQQAGPDLIALTATEWVPWPDALLVHLACTARHTGDDPTRRAATARLTRLAAENPGTASLQGAAALADGDFAGAVHTLRDTPRPLLLARAEEELGRAALAAGDRAEAVRTLDQARDRYAELGAAAPALRVQRVLQAAGVRRRRWSAVPQRPATGWAALTAMERRVALLVADGRTNRAVATELVLSPSTVSTHLRAAFSKLGVHSRVQLSNAVRENGSAG